MQLSQRSGAYKFGLALLFLGSAAFVVGFATSHWSRFRFHVHASGSAVRGQQTAQLEVHANSGLWHACFGYTGYSECVSFTDHDDWMTAVKVLECMAVAGLGLAAIFAVCVNFIVQHSTHTRFLESCSSSAGLAGVAAVVVYGCKSSADISKHNAMAMASASISLRYEDFTVHWSFVINAVGAALVIIASLFIAVSNKEAFPGTAGGQRGMVFTTLGLSAATAGSAPQAAMTMMPGGPGHAPYTLTGTGNHYAAAGSHVPYAAGGNHYAVSVVNGGQASVQPPPYFPPQYPAQGPDAAGPLPQKY